MLTIARYKYLIFLKKKTNIYEECFFFLAIYIEFTSLAGNELMCAFKSSGMLSGKIDELYGSGIQLKIF